MKSLRTLLLAGRRPPVTPCLRHVVCKQEVVLQRNDDGTKTPAQEARRSFHCSTCVSSLRLTPSAEERNKEQETGDSSLVTYEELFEKASKLSKSKAMFKQVLDVFCKKDIRRRGHVEFIYAALKRMPEFGVERDLAVYNHLLDVFPKEVFVARNFIQRMFNHYPRQQECAVQVLEQMETYGIMPSKDTKFLLLQIFGDKSHPIRKYQRIMYWFPRFKHVNPFPLPSPLPQDPIDLARLSLHRISADLDAKTTVYQMEPSEESYEQEEGGKQPYIIGIQSPDQRCLLEEHNPERPVVVEGPFPLWLKATRVFYYVLRADPLPPEERTEKVIDPERNLYYPMELDFQLERDLGDDDEFDVDEVHEGQVYAMCMVGSGDQATLAKWISGLQETNPILGRTSVIFRLESGTREIQATSDREQHRDCEELWHQKMTQ
ncbi:evolutionarily conserved signaling intermediate in Toll pathway, mitochondrial [Ambystoma mexicanum]|uniref:evolutionarily conserved signaling intermediate in Toll pathway, mitochondrial n=1 Tax=Ambystoma mexicanum TaxID=8296 RepID=UPI0037E89FF2